MFNKSILTIFAISIISNNACGMYSLRKIFSQPARPSLIAALESYDCTKYYTDLLQTTNITIKALVNTPSEQGYPLIHTAAYYGKTEIIDCLVEHGADVNAISKNGGIALHCTTKGVNCFKTIKCLVEHGAKINAPDGNTWTPLHVTACGPNDIAKIAYLVLKGADLNAKTDHGSTPLDLAKFWDKKGNVAFLKTFGLAQQLLHGKR